MFVKVYGSNGVIEQRRYRPPPCVGAIKAAIRMNTRHLAVLMTFIHDATPNATFSK
jgi:hypothetical protein